MRKKLSTRQLAPRHWKVVELVSQGLTNPEIARELGTTTPVIRNYLHDCFDRTGLDNRVLLAVWYIEKTRHPSPEV